MTYRLYIDEVGHAGMGPKTVVNDRYLCLMGMSMDRDYVQEHVAPELDRIKSEFFPRHALDRPVILHRKELMNRNYPFEALRDADLARRFDDRLVRFLSELECVLLLVAIDKFQHLRRYGEPTHPYHYCMDAMLERYVGWLGERSATGDVIAECRGSREDAALRAAFATTVSVGTGFRNGSAMRRALDSHELTLCGKKENVPGLQLVDLIAHPCFRRALARREGKEIPCGFARRITDASEPKFRRSSGGKLAGYGVKWLP